MYRIRYKSKQNKEQYRWLHYDNYSGKKTLKNRAKFAVVYYSYYETLNITSCNDPIFEDYVFDDIEKITSAETVAHALEKLDDTVGDMVGVLQELTPG